MGIAYFDRAQLPARILTAAHSLNSGPISKNVVPIYHIDTKTGNATLLVTPWNWGVNVQYRMEVEHLAGWCRDNNLVLNVDKMKEMIINFSRSQPEHTPLNISGSTVEWVNNIKFLGVQISDDLTWSKNTRDCKKKSLYFLRKLKQASLPTSTVIAFYRGMVGNVLTYCIVTRCGGCTVSDKKALQRVVRGAERIIGVSIPPVEDLFKDRCRKRAENFVKDPSHPLHKLYELLPSGKRHRSITRKTRLLKSFTPQAVRLLNQWHD